MQKQPSRGVLMKRCSEIMQQIYRRTPMSKCDFNKVAKQFLLALTEKGLGTNIRWADGVSRCKIWCYNFSNCYLSN